VISPVGSWRISKVANNARRTLDALSLQTQERILLALEKLQMDPFAGDVKKVMGKEDLYRLRIESLRIYFRLDRSSRSIEIALIDKRGQIKDKAIERL
jgi:mRNA-degrading endonuclease RelE of RelBE toxin-antitoxin system